MIGYYLLSTNVCMSLFKFIAFEKQEESTHNTDTRRSISEMKRIKHPFAWNAYRHDSFK